MNQIGGDVTDGSNIYINNIILNTLKFEIDKLYRIKYELEFKINEINKLIE